MVKENILSQKNYLGTHQELGEWVKRIAEFCQPDQVHWCDGSEQEYQTLCEKLVEKGTFIRLNPEKWPNSFACFSDPSDVARVEDRTYTAAGPKTMQARRTTGWTPRK